MALSASESKPSSRWAREPHKNYMNAAKFLEGKSAMISLLPPTTVYLLAADSTPKEIVTEVLAAADAGSVPRVDEIRERIAGISKAQQAARAAETAEHLKRNQENEKRRRAAQAARDREWREEQQSAEARRDKWATVVAEMLVSRLGGDGVLQLLNGLRGTDWRRVARHLKAMRTDVRT